MNLKTLSPKHFELLAQIYRDGYLRIERPALHKWPKSMFLAESLASLYFLVCTRRWSQNGKGPENGTSYAEFHLTDSGRIVLSLWPGLSNFKTVHVDSITHTGKTFPALTKPEERRIGKDVKLGMSCDDRETVSHTDSYTVSHTDAYTGKVTEFIIGQPCPDGCVQFDTDTGRCTVCGHHHGIKF